MTDRYDSRTDELSAREVLAVIRNDQRRVAAFTGVVTLIAVIYASLAPAYYASITSLYAAAPTDDSPLGQLQGISRSLDLAMSGPQPDIRIPDVLASRRLRLQVAKATWETERFPEAVSLIRYWGWDDDPRPEAEDRAVRRLGRMIRVSESTSGLLEMSVEMPEPQLAHDVAAFLSEKARDYVRSEYRSVASLHRKFVEERLVQTRAELQEAEDSLKNFLDANRRIVDSPTLQLEYGRLTREVEVRQEVFITLRQQDEMAKIAEIREAPVINVLDPPEVPIHRSRPRRLWIVSMAFVVSLAVASVGSLVQNRARNHGT